MEEIKLASVKFKSAGKIYYFSTNLKLKKDDRVVVETARGLELGEISQELKDISEFNLDTELKKIVRKATKKDIENYQKNVRDAKQALVTCKEIVSRYDVNMQLTNCEYTLDKAKVIFMYTSDDRVDFRELLKELAVVFKCRIELRQIGPRDKAKVIGGIGTCGLPLCCSTLLGEFNGVSINMAKNQMLAINIPVIIAMCITPMLVEKMKGLYRMNLAGYILGTAGRVGVIFAGYMGSVPLMLAFTAIAALGMAPWQGDMGAVVASCSEYTYLTKHKHIDGTMYSCTSFGTKIGGGIGVALCGWLLDASGFVKEAAVQPASCMNMLHIMYLWIPMILSLVITFIMSEMNVEAANRRLREQMEEC